jgi:hypothetical protein
MSDYTVYWPRYSGGFEIVAFLRTARPKKREHDVLQASYAFGFAKPDAPADAWKPPINHTDEWREWKGSQKRMYAAIKRLFDSVHVPGRDGHMYLFTKDDHEIFGHNVPFRTFVPEDENERRRPEMHVVPDFDAENGESLFMRPSIRTKALEYNDSKADAEAPEADVEAPEADTEASEDDVEDPEDEAPKEVDFASISVQAKIQGVNDVRLPYDEYHAMIAKLDADEDAHAIYSITGNFRRVAIQPGLLRYFGKADYQI